MADEEINMKEIPVKYQLNADPKNFLELWKWFTKDVAKIKDRMLTMATFFYTVLGVFQVLWLEHACKVCP